ncbi:MAG TPA: response regulator transcription factor [Anaerolineae bacterium]|nr:response regulator transcription factor [Anaerolineae bacterium]
MKERILIIDDDPNLVKVLQLILEKEGYEVVCATDGAEGLQQAYKTQPDLVISDITMPKMDGWEVCRRLRETSDVPIIMLTAKVGETNAVKSLELGADDYITKPFSIGELMAKVKAHLRRANSSSSREPPVFALGDLVVDFARQKVTVRGKAVNLTPREFRLLSCLVRNRGRVLPYTTILAQVWGPEYADGDGLDYLRLYIRYLRQKIEEDPSKPRYILTEWNKGYYFAG